MSKDVIQKPSTELATDADFASVGGTGFENVRPSDLLIPRLTIIQGLSPQVIKGKTEFDPEARVGDIYDVGLQERFPEGIEIVVAHFKTVWLEWSPRASGKGLIAIHDTEAIMKQTERDDNNRATLSNGNTVAETAQYFAINLTTPERRKSFLPMSSTQLKKSKRLLTLAQSERRIVNGVEEMPPLFWRSYFLTTVPERNAMGDWMGWKVERGTLVKERPDGKTVLREVGFFRDAVIAGRATGDLGGADEASSSKGF